MKQVSIEYDPAKEAPIWNRMHGMYVVGDKTIVALGLNYEHCKIRAENYRKTMNPNDFIHAAIYGSMEADLIIAISALKPYVAEWFSLRYGIGIN